MNTNSALTHDGDARSALALVDAGFRSLLAAVPDVVGATLLVGRDERRAITALFEALDELIVEEEATTVLRPADTRSMRDELVAAVHANLSSRRDADSFGICERVARCGPVDGQSTDWMRPIASLG